MSSLTNNVVIITGAARRMGALFVRMCLDAGAYVVLHYHRSRDAAQALAHSCDRSRVLVMQGDLRDVRFPQELINQTMSHFGRVDAVINNASLFCRMPSEATTAVDRQEMMRVNCVAPIQLAQCASQAMTSGVIINMIGYAATHPYPSYMAYSVSKASLLSDTESLAKCLSPSILVYGVSPRLIALLEDVESPWFQELSQQWPDGMVSQPEDVCCAVLHLLTKRPTGLVHINHKMLRMTPSMWEIPRS